MAQSKKVKQTWVLFVVTFLVSLVIITYFIKSMSPDVDVEVGGDDEQATQEDSASGVKQAIDDRLRWIQMEDNMPGASKRTDGQPTDEVTYQNTDKTQAQNDQSANGKKQDTKQLNKEEEPVEYVNTNQQHNNQHKTVTKAPVPTQQAEPFRMSKVYVGTYPTIEQAIQAQNRLMNTSVSVSPFVKEVNGSYVLQAGSYANAGKAESVAREINSVGFHARIVKE